MDEVTTIAMPPQEFWGLVFAFGLILLTAAIYLVLAQFPKTYRAPAWEQLPMPALAALVPLAVLWFALFLLTIWAAFWGTYQLLMSHPVVAGQVQPAGLGALGLGTLLAGLLGAPFVIWSTILKHQNTAIQFRLSDLSTASHFNDKLSAAIEGLNARFQVTRVVGEGGEERVLTEWQDDVLKRSAAIDRLEGLAKERPQEAPRIASMLSLYVRELSRALPAKEHPRYEWLRMVEPEDDSEAIGEDQALHQIGLEPDHLTVAALNEWAQTLKPARPDMEKAAQTLGRLRKIDGVALDEVKIDLRDANLQGFDLFEAQFDEANFQGARMEGALFAQASLIHANLKQVRMSGALFFAAKMERANLSSAHAEATYFSNTYLQKANFLNTRLERAIFHHANLNSTVLSGALLIAANFWQADLTGASLDHVLAYGAIFQGAVMRGASFRKAKLNLQTNFQNAKLRGVGWKDINLSKTGEPWSGVQISQNIVDKTFGDGSVVLPEDFLRPIHWPIQDLHPNDFQSAWRKWLASLET